MKKNLQRFGASVLAAAMVAQSVALPAAAETTKIDSSVAQSVAASAASAASAVQSLPKFTSTADLIKQTAQTLAAQGEVHELEQDDAKLEATAQSKAGMSLAALENALADAMYANAAAGKINTEAYGLNKDEMASVMAATIKTYHLSSAVTDLGYETNAAGVVTAVTFTGSSGMTSAMESMTNSDDEVIINGGFQVTGDANAVFPQQQVTAIIGGFIHHAGTDALHHALFSLFGRQHAAADPFADIGNIVLQALGQGIVLDFRNFQQMLQQNAESIFIFHCTKSSSPI